MRFKRRLAFKIRKHRLTITLFHERTRVLFVLIAKQRRDGKIFWSFDETEDYYYDEFKTSFLVSESQERACIREKNAL